MIRQIEDYFRKEKTAERRIDILTVKQTMSIAKVLQRFLRENGYLSDIYTERRPIFDKTLYVIFSPQAWYILPLHYCVFQVEQLTYDGRMSLRHRLILRQAVAIFDYSIENYNILKKSDVLRKKTYLLPFDIDNTILEKASVRRDKKYDVLFYGYLASKRRRKFLSEIKKDYKIKIIQNMYGEELFEELKKAYIIVNIHFSEQATLETCRISEILSLGNSIIVSEDGIDHKLDRMFKPMVEFVTAGDIEAMKEKLGELLSDKERLLEKIEENKERLLNRDNNFEKYAKKLFV